MRRGRTGITPSFRAPLLGQRERVRPTFRSLRRGPTRGAPNAFGGEGRSLIAPASRMAGRDGEDERFESQSPGFTLPAPWTRGRAWSAFSGQGTRVDVGMPFLRTPVPILLERTPQCQIIPPSDLRWIHREVAQHQCVESFMTVSGTTGDTIDIYLNAGRNEGSTCNNWSKEGSTCKIYKVTWDLARHAAITIERILAGWDELAASGAEQLEHNAYKQVNASPDGDMLAFRVIPAGESEWRLGLMSLTDGWVGYFNNERTGVGHFPAFLGSAERLIYHVEDGEDDEEYVRSRGSVYVADIQFETPSASNPNPYALRRGPLVGNEAGSHFRNDPYSVADVAVDYSWNAPNNQTYRIVGHGVRLVDGIRWQTWTEEQCKISPMTSMGNLACAMPRVMTLDRGRVGADGDYVDDVEEFDNAVRNPPWPAGKVPEGHMLYGCHHPAWSPDGSEVLCSAMQYAANVNYLDFGETENGGGYTQMLFSFVRHDVSVYNPWRTWGLTFDPVDAHGLASRLGSIFEPALRESDSNTTRKCWRYQYKFAQWCGRDDLILTTIFCSTEDGDLTPESVPHSRVVLIKRATSAATVPQSTYFDISRAVEEHYEGSGASTIGRYSAVYGTCARPPAFDPGFVALDHIPSQDPRYEEPITRHYATAAPAIPSGIPRPPRASIFGFQGMPVTAPNRVGTPGTPFDAGRGRW